MDVRKSGEWLAGALLLAAVAGAGCANGGTTGAGEAAGAASAPAAASDDEIEMTRIEVGDFTFDVRTAGPEDGEAVILLHGFPQTSYEWRHQIRGLAAAGFRVVAPDQRGYSPGARPPDIADYALPLLVQDVLDLAEPSASSAFTSSATTGGRRWRGASPSPHGIA